MSVPNGNRYPFSHSPIRVAARNALAGAGLALVLATASQAHPPWTRIAQRESWAPDLSWGPRPFGAKGPSRLVEGGEERLFLTVGDSLYMGRDGGRHWEAVPISSQAYNFSRRLALAANGSGLVLWGERISHDFGRTWDPPRMPGTGLADVYSINGYQVLGGGMYDNIARSEDAGNTWKSVYQGRTYGSIVDFAHTWKGSWHLAAPQTDQVLASRDGIAWKPLASLVKAAKPAYGTGAAEGPELRASILGLENMAYDQVLWAVESSLSGKAVLAEIRIVNESGEPKRDSFDIVRHARDVALQAIETAWKNGETLEGWQVDDVARGIIAAAGFGENFHHRTGHSMGPGKRLHGLGVNLDNLETHDTRRILPRTGFSIEPAIYLPEFGVRLEINVFLDPVAGPSVTAPTQTEIVRLV